MIKIYKCPTIGDGKTLETAFRPFLNGLSINHNILFDGQNYFIIKADVTETEHKQLLADNSITEIEV